MKNHYHFVQYFRRSIFLLNLFLQNCSNLSNPIIPIQEKQIPIHQQVNKPKERLTSLGNSVKNDLDLMTSYHGTNEEVGINSSTYHLAITSAVGQVGFLTSIQELPSDDNHNNYLSILTSHSQKYAIKQKPAQPIRGMPSEKVGDKKQKNIQSTLTKLEQSLLEKEFTTQEGYQLQLYKEAAIWQAEVIEKHGSLSRPHRLPVYTDADMCLAQVAILNTARQASLIQVNLPRNKQPGYVYVGNRGLQGGGKTKISGIPKANSMPAIPGYKVHACLHEGASSNIYRAVRLSDEYPVVIKVSTQKVLTEKKAGRFRQEFELGRRVHSPYVVRYLELKQDLTYGIALVMEDDQAIELSSDIPPPGFSNYEFLEIAIQIVRGLQAIHEVNIIHSDLKLSNILIQPTTKDIKIIDFNRASAVREERCTAIPMMAGTLAYISPEQTDR